MDGDSIQILDNNKVVELIKLEDLNKKQVFIFQIILSVLSAHCSFMQ